MLTQATRYDCKTFPGETVDSIEHLFRTVVFEPDDIEINSAMIYGPPEFPEVIEFYQGFAPTPFGSPSAVWKRGIGYAIASM